MISQDSANDFVTVVARVMDRFRLVTGLASLLQYKDVRADFVRHTHTVWLVHVHTVWSNFALVPVKSNDFFVNIN